jgi:hypothetical protein
MRSGDDQRGARFRARFNRATTLYPAGPKTRTTMQSCASAAKLRSGGPILPVGVKAKGHVGIPPPRTVIGTPSQSMWTRAAVPIPHIQRGQLVDARLIRCARRRVVLSAFCPHSSAGRVFALFLNNLIGVLNRDPEGKPLNLGYTQATQAGAAGAPVFDVDTGELVAIHHLSKDKVGVGVSIVSVIAAIGKDLGPQR